MIPWKNSINFDFPKSYLYLKLSSFKLEYLLIGEPIDVEDPHLLDDGGLAGLGRAQEQDLDGGVPAALGHVLEHVMIMHGLHLLLLLPLHGRRLRRLLAQTAQKSAKRKANLLSIPLVWW